MKKKSLLLTVVATLGLTAATMAQNVPSYVPTNGLIGWWPFNGNAIDESGNGNNGIVNGATLTIDRFGNADKAYLFNGSSNNIYTTCMPPTSSNSRSFNLWAATSNNSHRTVLSYGTIGGTGTVFEVGIGDHFNDGCEGLIVDISNGHRTISGNLNDNSWHMYTIVCDNSGQLSSISYFIDGLLITSSCYSSPTTINTGNSTPLTIGRLLSTNVRDFDGKIDDIGAWNRTLTQQEISDLFNGNICYQTITVTDTLLINMGITGFNPITYNNTIKIFPNPTNDHITIDYGNFASLTGYQLKIENSLGQQVFQTNVNQQSDYLSLTNWGGNGLYFVRIIDSQGNTIDIRKIILQ